MFDYIDTWLVCKKKYALFFAFFSKITDHVVFEQRVLQITEFYSKLLGYEWKIQVNNK